MNFDEGFDFTFDDDPAEPVKSEGGESNTIEPVVGQDDTLETHVDLVYCIDITGSMARTIDLVKAQVRNFHEKLSAELLKVGRRVDKLRIKVIAFRDIYVDSVPFVESKFFNIPEEESSYRSFLDGLTATGGGDEPENALEALAKAIQIKDWCTGGARRRHIIVMFTDASAHPLEKHVGNSKCPAGVPDDLDTLEAMWSEEYQEPGRLQVNARRMVLFAPNKYPWTDIAENWELVLAQPLNAGRGGEELSQDSVIEMLRKSM